MIYPYEIACSKFHNYNENFQSSFSSHFYKLHPIDLRLSIPSIDHKTHMILLKTHTTGMTCVKLTNHKHKTFKKPAKSFLSFVKFVWRCDLKLKTPLWYRSQKQKSQLYGQ